MTDFKITQTRLFEKLIKKLSKRYINIESDIDLFIDTLKTSKDLGIPLGKNLFKVRIKNSDIIKGKSAGYRLISYLNFVKKEITFIYIYSKSDLKSISEKEIDIIVTKTIIQSE